MATTRQDGVLVEKFARNGGSFVSVLGALVIVAAVAGWAFDAHDVPLWVPETALLAGVLLYVSTVRPRVMVEGDELVLRNMLSTVRLPLAAIDGIAVQQVVAVRAGERRYRCAGAGRSLRTVLKGAGMHRGLRRTEIQPGMDYADYIETRVMHLVEEDRARRGISSTASPEARELAGQVTRRWAWPESVVLVVAVVGLVAGIALG